MNIEKIIQIKSSLTIRTQQQYIICSILWSMKYMHDKVINHSNRIDGDIYDKVHENMKWTIMQLDNR